MDINYELLFFDRLSSVIEEFFFEIYVLQEATDGSTDQCEVIAGATAEKERTTLKPSPTLPACLPDCQPSVHRSVSRTVRVLGWLVGWLAGWLAGLSTRPCLKHHRIMIRRTATQHRGTSSELMASDSLLSRQPARAVHKFDILQSNALNQLDSPDKITRHDRGRFDGKEMRRKN